MYRDHRIVVVTPAAERRFLEVLVPQVMKYFPIVDEYQLWVNTNDGDDLDYMKSLADVQPGIRLKLLPNGRQCSGTFFRECTDADAVYVRIDEGIVMLDTIRAFEAFLDHRIDHPEYFVVYANVLNNAIVTHLQQRHGNFSLEKGLVGYERMDPLGWHDGAFAVDVHRTILSRVDEDGDLSAFHFCPEWRLANFERVGINCISWLGSCFDGDIGPDDELWIACLKPRGTNRINTVFGGFCAVYLASRPQRASVEAAGILECYREKTTGRSSASSSRTPPCSTSSESHPMRTK